MIGPELVGRKLQRKHYQDGIAFAGLEQRKGLEDADAKGKGVLEHDANDQDSSDFDSLFEEDPRVENGQKTDLEDAGAEAKDVVEQDAKDEDTGDLDSLFGEGPEVENGPDNGNNRESNDETTKQSATNSLIKRSSDRVAQKYEASSAVDKSGADVEKTADVNMAEPKARDTSKKPESENESNPLGGAKRNALTAVKLLYGLNSALEKDEPLQKHDIPKPIEAETKHRSSKRKAGDAELCEASPSDGKHQRTTRDTKKLPEKTHTEQSGIETKSESKKPSKMATNKAPAKKYAQLRTRVSR